MWNLKWASKFVRQYKRLDTKTKQAVDDAIADIVSSEDPSSLGVYKSDMRIFSYEIGRKYRVVYSIQYREGIVALLRVCDHKSVYGKD